MAIHMDMVTIIQDIQNLLANSRMDSLLDNAQKNQQLNYLLEISIKMEKEEGLSSINLTPENMYKDFKNQRVV